VRVCDIRPCRGNGTGCPGLQRQPVPAGFRTLQEGPGKHPQCPPHHQPRDPAAPMNTEGRSPWCVGGDETSVASAGAGQGAGPARGFAGAAALQPQEYSLLGKPLVSALLSSGPTADFL